MTAITRNAEKIDIIFQDRAAAIQHANYRLGLPAEHEHAVDIVTLVALHWSVGMLLTDFSVPFERLDREER
jgi:hypothetical protein